MSMVIMNNSSAMMALGQLNKNTSKLSKDLEKVSSGMKLNSAGDGSSEYAISERMRVMIRSLDQDKQNVQNGTSLFKVAEGGIQEIIDELRNIRELALNSANDHNTDADRATIQKEYEHKIANIDDIASTTNYNGKILLDGRYGKNFKISGATSSTPVSTGVVEPTGLVATLSASTGNYTISAGGVYELAAGYTGTITIASGVADVEIRQQDSSTALTDVYIVGPSGGNANLWIDGLNVVNKQDKSLIDFQGSNNVLSIKNTNSMEYNTLSKLTHAVVHAGGGLTVEGSGTLDVNMSAVTLEGAVIGTNREESAGSTDITINSGTFNISAVGSTNAYGALIGAGYNSSMGDITINGGAFDLYGRGPCIGGGYVSNYVGSWGVTVEKAGEVGDITIRNATIRGETAAGACIGSGNNVGVSSTVGDILIENSVIEVYGGDDGAGIGSGRHATGGDITIRDSEVTATSKFGAGIGSGYGGNPAIGLHSASIGNITIIGGSISASSTYGENIGKGYNSTCGTVTFEDSSRSKYNPLIIHSGAKANQATKFYINDMRTDALGLTNVALTTQPKAQSALNKIDKSIEYALNEMTAIGSYLSRLEYTESNITTANENVIASESTIRDADMAKSMTEYTKSNVLSQAAQSMLAQANQNASAVLSLLQ